MCERSTYFPWIEKNRRDDMPVEGRDSDIALLLNMSGGDV